MKPDILLPPSGPSAICHLGKGFVSENNVSFAWTANGSVKMTGTPEELSSAELGFIQFAEQFELGIEYSGAEPAGGSIAIDPAQPPTWTHSTQLLDSDIGFRPWTRPSPRFTTLNAVSTAETGDHPMIKVARKLTNRTTQTENFLRSITDSRHFTTVFTLKDTSTNPQRPTGPRNQYLAHFTWDIRYRFDLIWKGGVPHVEMNASKATFGPITMGPPPAMANMLSENNQAGPDFNEISRAALRSAVVFGQPPARRDEATRFLSTPKNFFT
ncbi:hypothetical protein MWN34_03310 [Ancylobacter sp. 6x-1]|uniref:Uncharacterized protein n=1 Tax=Ancylobacter crimeensis TaxID=2579147 RepID=A0ABT0D7K5_9HYPH|nr:hypothetical protein [Ancylobacter crimeensis]MCK0195933.1 hypothetical protein [Ancylobacter crimeensis]